MSTELRARAAELGVQTEYHDVDGVLHHADAEVLDRVVEVLDADRARHRPDPAAAPPLHHASAGPVPVGSRVSAATLVVDGASTGLVVQHGAETDLVELPDDLPWGCHMLSIESDHGAGRTVVVVAPPAMPRSASLAGTGSLFAPTYALWEIDQPLPSFRHLHELARTVKRAGVGVVSTLPLYATFLDDPVDPSPYSPVSRLHWNEVYLDDAALPAAPAPPLGDTVDWEVLAARRRRQLVSAVELLTADEHAELDRFVARQPDVGEYARFRATRDGAGDPVVERSHVLAQWLAERELTAIAEDPDAASLALDLPIGSSGAGFEVWADPTMYAAGISVGAPPDSFFADGQSWGFPPPLPAAMAASGHRPWRELIERVGRHADVLRIDHAMAVERLWWVPDGFGADRGVYVHYPREDLLAVIAATAATVDLTIVGEDLGTVPVEVSEAFARWDMIGMYEEQFHLDDDPLPHVPARSVAGIRTHDMEPIANLVATDDTSRYRRLLGDAHGTTIGAGWGPVVDEMLVRLAASDAYMVSADLDDLVGEVRPHNLPGRVVPGLWSRRLRQPTSTTLADPAVQRRLSVLSRQERA